MTPSEIISPFASAGGDVQKVLEEATFRSQLRQVVVWPIASLIGLACLLLGVVNYLLYSANLVSQTGRVLAQLTVVERLLVDRETGLRGYQLTGEAEFLAPYENAGQRLPLEILALEKVVAENPAQVERVSHLRAIEKEWDAFADKARGQVIQKLPPQLALNQEGKLLFDRLRENMGQFRTSEEQVLSLRTTTLRRVKFLSEASAALFGLIVAPLLGLWIRRMIFRMHTDFRGTLNELQLTEKKGRDILNSITDGFHVVDASGRFTYFNAAARRMFAEQGINVDSQIGRHIFEDTLPGAENVEAGRALQRTLTGRLPTEAENFFEPWQRWMAVRHFPTAEGGASTFFQDITLRKETASSLQASEERFRAAIGAVSSLLWTNNAEGKMEGEQPGWGNFTGQTYPEYQEYGWSKAIHPEDAQRTIDAWEKALSARTIFIFEHRVRRHDGEWRLCSVRAVPVVSNGVVREWVGVHTDITERRSVQNQLKESEERFRTLADGIAQFAWMADEKGWLFWYNQQWFDFTGTTLEEMNGWGWTKVHHPEHLARVTAKWKDHLSRQVAWEDTFPLRGKNGEFRWFLSRARPIRNRQGTVVQWFGTNTDITEQREVEEELRKTQALLQVRAKTLEQGVSERTRELEATVSELESFSYSISHDLRAPLRAMQTFATILRNEWSDRIDADGRDYLRRIITAADRMDRLIQDVLVFSRISRNKMPLERIELGTFIAGLIESYSQFGYENADMEIIFPLAAVRANPAALTQCLSNLLGNALKFVAPGVKPKIEIWTEAVAERARIFVRDNGIGIEKQDQEKIFGIFNQVDPSRGGTGIGLAVVRKAAERMGGTVGLFSEGGHGSTFCLDLESA